MDRGIWKATVYGVTRVRQDWATKHTSINQINTLIHNLPYNEVQRKKDKTNKVPLIFVTLLNINSGGKNKQKTLRVIIARLLKSAFACVNIYNFFRNFLDIFNPWGPQSQENKLLPESQISDGPRFKITCFKQFEKRNMI